MRVMTNYENVDLVRLPGGFAIPRRFTATIMDERSPFDRVTIEVVPDDAGEPRITELIVRPREGKTITTDGLRRIPLAKYLRAARIAATLRQRSRGTFRRVRDEDIVDLADLYQPVRGAPRPRLNDDDLRRAVDIYRAAIGAGDPRPVKTLMRAMNLSRPTAGRWIDEARRRGILGDAPGRGKAGER